ncbi:TPA: Ig-like domain-containing protein [Staphylococcus aureus]|nr:Ig-like domain-containing protein [Staphylococcus aureus]
MPDSIKTLKVGDTYDLNVVVEPSNQSKLLKYTTDQTNIVSINSDGQVTAEAQGIATVKATVGNMSDTITSIRGGNPSILFENKESIIKWQN